MQVFITVVNFPNNPSVVPTVLGAFRTGEATLFSWDVAVQKGRTAVGFSTNSLALSTRSVGFLAQTFYPPGLDVQDPGPYYGLQEAILRLRSRRAPAIRSEYRLCARPAISGTASRFFRAAFRSIAMAS